MIRDSLVAINIINKDNNSNVLLQDSTVPILFYWDGSYSIKESLLHDKKFINKIIDLCVNVNRYTSSVLSYFYFIYKDDNEKYEDETIDIQEFLSLEKLSEEYNFDCSSLYNSYLYNIFKDLYSQSMNNSFSSNNDYLFDNSQEIVQMYEEIRNKYKERFVKESCVNYVRTKLIKIYQLNSANTSKIIEYLNELIK